MTFITSSVMRERDEDARKFWADNIDPVTGYALSQRQPEGNALGMMFTYNLQASGRPDLIITGTDEVHRERHRWILNTLVAGMLSKLPLEHKYDYALDINRQLVATNLQSTFMAVVVNTDQWINGFGLNHRRYYQDIPKEEQIYIQIIEAESDGAFPIYSTNRQILLPTVNYSEKEPQHASVFSNSQVPRQPNRESVGNVTRH